MLNSLAEMAREYTPIFPPIVTSDVIQLVILGTPGFPKISTVHWRAQKYLKSVSWSVIVISNLVMSIVEKEPSGFRITVKQPVTAAC